MHFSRNCSASLWDRIHHELQDELDETGEFNFGDMHKKMARYGIYGKWRFLRSTAAGADSLTYVLMDVKSSLRQDAVLAI